MVLEGFQIEDSYVDTNSKRAQALAQNVIFETKNTILDNYTSTDGSLPTGKLAELETAQSNMQSVIEWYITENETLKAVLQNNQTASFSYSDTVNTKRSELEKMQKTVEEERELNAVRDEQVSSLQNRYEANTYSSWMGLRRSLEEGSHVGLLVAAGAFLILGFLAIYYMYRVGAIPVLGLGYTGFRGGLHGGLRSAVRNRVQR